jgi:hypothetical protein
LKKRIDMMHDWAKFVSQPVGAKDPKVVQGEFGKRTSQIA